MRSAAAAIAWEFRQRHRGGLLGLTGYLLALAIIKFLIRKPGQPVDLNDVRFALVVVVPLAVTFTYSLAVFTFGLSGDLAARQSMYPARMFTLPVTTAALAGWPMLYGTAAMTILWLATRLMAVWPSGFAIPVIWPALLAAALLAWTQALTWMPYGLPGLRVVVAILLLAAIDSVVILAIHYDTREAVMVAGLAPLVPLAYLAARFAVARARRGEVPDWRGIFARIRAAPDAAAGLRRRFASPAAAQSWFEWRRHGRSLPTLVAILLPLELALLFLAGPDAPNLVLATLLGVLLTPPFLATFVAATVRKSNPQLGDSHGLPPFIATRPLSSAALVGVTLTTAIRSTLVAWALVLLGIPLALVLSGTGVVVIERMNRIAGAIGSPRAIVLGLLVLSGLLASTWKQLAQSLYLGLTGREWVVKASVFLALAGLAVVGPLAVWVSEHTEVQVALWNALPFIFGGLAVGKMSAAAGIAVRLYRGRVLRDSTLVTGAAGWFVAVLALYGLLLWLASDALIPRYLLLLVAILAVPLARLSAAPLALEWNRHR